MYFWRFFTFLYHFITFYVTDIIERLYGNADFVEERHRHRYEVNPKYVEELEQAGLSFVGRDETGERMEITELKGIVYHL